MLRNLQLIAGVFLAGTWMASMALGQAKPPAGARTPPPGAALPPSSMTEEEDLELYFAPIKQQLSIADEDYKIIVPKLRRIEITRGVALDTFPPPNSAASRVPKPMTGRLVGAPTSPGGTPLNMPPRDQMEKHAPVQLALNDLQAVLDDKSAGPDVIRSRLENLRAIRAKCLADWAAAEADLKSNLTQKQEAILVLDGYLR